MEDKFRNVKLKKRRKTLNRTYYYLVNNGRVIGKAWTTNRQRMLINSMHMTINKSLRRKGYGRVFYRLLMDEMSEKDIGAAYMWVNKRNTVAINFLENVVDRYSTRFKFLNLRGYEEVIWEDQK